MLSKNELRKKYIKKHGPGCETCSRNPVNYGQRDSCPLEDEYCTEEYEYGKKCPAYGVAISIYSIDISHVC
jgi:hypothetical protein